MKSFANTLTKAFALTAIFALTTTTSMSQSAFRAKATNLYIVTDSGTTFVASFDRTDVPGFFPHDQCNNAARTLTESIGAGDRSDMYKAFLNIGNPDLYAAVVCIDSKY